MSVKIGFNRVPDDFAMSWIGKIMLLSLGAFFLLSASLWSQAPANDNCSNATTLTVDGACTTGTTQNGTIEGGESTSCFTGGAGCNVEQTTWYAFNTGSNTQIWLDLEVTNSPNCSGGYAVYGPFATATCLPGAGSQVACENTPPAIRGTMLTGLSTNSVYMIQVMGRNGGGSGDRYMEYCVGVESVTSCATCSSPCGGACGFSSTPTVAQVTSTCTRYNLTPHINDGTSGTWCYNMTAVNSSVDFGLIINQIGCAGGNISTMSWEVYNFSSCTGPVASGTFPTLTATGLTPGANYTFCYSLTVAAACTHTAHWPFWVGASILPMELTTFEAEVIEHEVALNWVAKVDERSRFVLERSLDGASFEEIGSVSREEGFRKREVNGQTEELSFLFRGDNGSGKSDGFLRYEFIDEFPAQGKNYYRLKVTDQNGNVEYSDPQWIEFEGEDFLSEVSPNPVLSEAHLTLFSPEYSKAAVKVFSLAGKEMFRSEQELESGSNAITISSQGWSPGIYFVVVENHHQRFVRKMMVR